MHTPPGTVNDALPWTTVLLSTSGLGEAKGIYSQAPVPGRSQLDGICVSIDLPHQAAQVGVGQGEYVR
jgi:hypothetical protein